MPSPMPNAQMDSSQASLDPSNSASKLFVSSWRRSSVTRNSPAETSGLIHDRHVPTRMSGNEAVHPDHNPLPDPIRSVSDPIRCVPFRSGHPSLPLADNSPAQTFDSYTWPDSVAPSTNVIRRCHSPTTQAGSLRLRRRCPCRTVSCAATWPTRWWPSLAYIERS